jgi:mono/diheme cytochrome c family protein
MNEKKIHQILEMVLWVINPLLIVLAFYNQELKPGLFMLWMGKFHPLVLHFPIVFGIVIAIYLLFFQLRRLPLDTEKLILASNGVFATVVAILGLLLSKQNSYDNDLLNWHKWGGIAIAILSWSILYLLDLQVKQKKYLAICFFIVLMVATHKGAQLTHGVNALGFPQAASTVSEQNPGESKTIYVATIAPILDQKCVSCHNADKAKGGLRLDSPEYIQKGGKDGSILKGDAGQLGKLLERIHLPLTDEKHMPPDGKEQLTKTELSILSNWINSGSNFQNKITDLPSTDSLALLIGQPKKILVEKFEPKHNLPDLKEYNSNYCTTNYLFHGTDEVEVNFFQGTFYKRDNLKKLSSIKSNIISLNMSGMPLTNDDLDIIVGFKNLQRLNLNNTNLGIDALQDVKSLKKLRLLSICGIEFNNAALDKFLANAKFTELNVWTKDGTPKDLEPIIKKYPNIIFNVGDNLKTTFVKISKPTIEQDSLIISDHLDIKLKALLKGVVIRYTTDGTDPDSLKSSVYEKPFRIKENTTLKIKAFRDGWTGSEIVKKTFYKSEIHPDSILLLTQPDIKHPGHGAKTLIDYDLGESNKYTDKWLGYKDTGLDFLIGFKEPRLLKSAYFNAFIELGAAIFPIASITVQGSNDGVTYKKIVQTKFPPAIQGAAQGPQTFTCPFPEGTTYKFYKFNVANLKRQPSWRKDNKGKPAWIYVDELFLN